jgi:hypothetical protein
MLKKILLIFCLVLILFSAQCVSSPPTVVALWAVAILFLFAGMGGEKRYRDY